MLQGRNSDAPSWSYKYWQRLTLAEQTAVDLTLTIFKIETVVRAIQICHFTFFNTRNAQGTGDFLDRAKHCLLSSLFHFFDDQKIGATEVNYHLSKIDAAMRSMHIYPESCSFLVIK
ncbi:hypothetical protein GA0061102_102121 [Rhizobium miluonense]|uniref:Uncharacterized protein n=1 Tax=Rhizobium miluonense TaxID=411945 RepID=A0A1C3W0T5_9HYPH|nr:hypothetical protein GA0061102_102121 [Rhizobium miluonense]